ncbi:uncharacterized protein LOC135497570 [Lineus longissimus]|uniref:uncharacterized protein LOC135497570 n=1 Tax=Lineus longissimus TaxID=88925 RepID=UPI002B4FAB26
MERDIENSSSLHRHDELRRYLNGQIPNRDLKILKDSIQSLGLLEPKFLEDHVSDFSDIFLKLVGEKIISVGKYGQLIMLFKSNRLLKLAEYVQQIQDNFPPPAPNFDLPKPFDETRGKTNIYRQETKKPDPDMGPGSSIDVRGHKETESGGACGTEHKNLSIPDAVDHGADGNSGYYGKGRSSDMNEQQVDPREVQHKKNEVENQQPIIQPAKLLPRRQPEDTSSEAENMQCDSDPQPEGMTSSYFDEARANQPPVSQRDISETTDGVSNMHIDPPETDPIPEPIGDRTSTGSRPGIPPLSSGSMYPNAGGAPQNPQPVYPDPPPVSEQPPSVAQQTAPIIQNANITGFGNMGNVFVGGEMTICQTSQATDVTMAQQQKGKRPTGTSQAAEGVPVKKGSIVMPTVTTVTRNKSRPPKGVAKGEPSTIRQTSNISGMGNFGNVFCAGDMNVTKTIQAVPKK